MSEPEEGHEMLTSYVKKKKPRKPRKGT